MNTMYLQLLSCAALYPVLVLPASFLFDHLESLVNIKCCIGKYKVIYFALLLAIGMLNSSCMNGVHAGKWMEFGGV